MAVRISARVKLVVFAIERLKGVLGPDMSHRHVRDASQLCRQLALPRVLSHRWLLLCLFPWSIPRREPLIQHSTDFSTTSTITTSSIGHTHLAGC